MLAKSFVFSMIMICLSQFAVASNNPSNSTLREEIAANLQDMSMQNLGDISEVTIKFIINDEKQLIVLGSNNKDLQRKIEYRLNFKTIKADDVKINQVYTIPIKIKKK